MVELMIKLTALYLFGLMISTAACAESMIDPTQPAQSFASELNKDNPEATEAEAPIVLQSILISSGRKFAIVSGQTLYLGSKFREFTLVEISDKSVVLKGANNTVKKLHLFPNVEKK